MPTMTASNRIRLAVVAALVSTTWLAYSVVAAYRMRVEGWPLAEAEQEMQAFGFNDVWVNFKRFIRRYVEDVAKR